MNEPRESSIPGVPEWGREAAASRGGRDIEWQPRPGEMHPVDQAFYDLAVKERNYERLRVDRLQAENQRLRDGYCDEAYILMVQALDVKALPKGRRRILTEQARRMATIGLGRGWPRPQGDFGTKRLQRLAADVLAQLGEDDA